MDRSVLFGSFILIIILYFNSTSSAQNPRESYLNSDFKEQTFDKKEWKNLTKDLDYTDKPPEEPEFKQKSSEPIFHAPNNLAGILKTVAIILAIVLATVVLIHLMGFDNLFGPRNRKIKKDSPDINIENIEEYIHETELERFIREAIESGNYPLAIRLYYLEVIKQLSLNKLIKWKKDKTNGEYLRELRGSDFHPSFRELTLIFERIWYGKTDFVKEDFVKVEPKFKELINQISNQRKSV